MQSNEHKNTIHNRRSVLICTGGNNCLREERERLENGKSLHTAASKTEEAIAHGIFRLWEMEEKETRNHYCQLAEIIGHKTNYRK